jgi:hypothetical protein
MEQVENKRCYVCNKHKSREEFYKSSKAKDGLRFECKSCSKEVSIAYAKKNWQKKIQPKTRGYRLKHRYGISIQEYQSLFGQQAGLCGICKERLIENGNGFTGVSVDHSHGTGKVRGLLCGQCNGALGKFRDSTVILQSAIDYLRKYETDLETSS